MPCACSKSKLAANRAAKGKQFVYDFTAPGTTDVVTYGSPIDARAAARREGGGKIRRRQVNTDVPVQLAVVDAA